MELLDALAANQCYLGILTRNNLINTLETLRAANLKVIFLICISLAAIMLYQSPILMVFISYWTNGKPLR